MKEFFGDPTIGKTIPDLKNFLSGKPHFTTHWIAYYNQSPFAYLLTSVVTVDQVDIYGKWREKEGKTYTLDLLIGEEEFLGKGLSHLMIEKFINDQFPNAAAFLIDPETRNTQAIHVYEKTGFVKVEEFCPEPGRFAAGIPHVMMKLNLKTDFDLFLNYFCFKRHDPHIQILFTCTDSCVADFHVKIPLIIIDSSRYLKI